MKIFVTKASNHEWYEFTEINNIIELYKKYGNFIIEENWWTHEDIPLIEECFDYMNKQDVIIMHDCELQLTIYDDYVE